MNCQNVLSEHKPIKCSPVKVYLAYIDGGVIRLVESARYYAMCSVFSDGSVEYDLSRLDIPCLIDSCFKGSEYLYINPLFSSGDKVTS